MRSHAATDDITVLAHAEEIPGLGHLPVNAFVLHADQPLLVDTGMPAAREDFLDLLWAAVDPDDLRYVWITHPDRDHTGALMQVLAAAPQAKLVTTFMGYGILSIEHEIPLDRLRLVNPGEQLDLGDRVLTGFRPPLYDSPVTTGFRDSRTGAVFASDCFGAPLPSADLATADDARDVPAADLAGAMQVWAVADSPWVQLVDRARYAASLREFGEPGLPLVLSTHLPPARELGAELLDAVAAAPDVPMPPEPDQAALEAMLASLAPQPRSPEHAPAPA
jgi:hypothetical protein